MGRPQAITNRVAAAAQAAQDANNRQKVVLRQAAQVKKNQLPTRTTPGKSTRAVSPGIKL